MENVTNAANWASKNPKTALGVLIVAFILMAWLF